MRVPSLCVTIENGVAEEKKADKSPVTQADRDAEILLEAELAKLVRRAFR